ncbi:glycoside hydrolase family 2 TIM barrel-domain containing protein [Allomuricauda sp. ARW1Y1]|jgi:beta-galactosidase|uniref:glycoside hydrolase family 2 TIM barrel-domain containing protein n=1 Tax=Allomuricauda sp. ARW1Y1 TaxID=2663843 RepID=UPI0015CDD78B|nr:glycoside hydrolase family 2 TIM barrel-domain containing protein [Muricauda sp. ARW1Y1]NYJ27891.1 beta-galactosidase [Muricauda sp. ARW1Y1]
MHKITFLFFFLLIPLVVLAQGNMPWQTPDIVKINKLPARATSISYPDLKLARQADRDASPFKRSLNGAWRFFWTASPDLAPDGFYKKDYNDETWDNIPVPSNWELQGYGKPWQRLTPEIWKDIQISFPHIPEDYNPTGSYRKVVSLPETWENKQITLHIGAASSAFRVWVNSQFVGYSEDNRLPAEFDITSYLRQGDNLIALQVLQWSDGSYIEDQDHWRMSGITREVYLEASPQVQIYDFAVRTELDDTFTDAQLQIRPEIKNYASKDISNYVIEAYLYDADNTAVLDSPFTLPVAKLLNEYHPQIGNRPFENLMDRTIRNPKKWSAEDPNLYTLVLALRDEEGKLVEARSTRIGFREIDTQDGQFRVNGIPVLLYGVNRHDWDATMGKAVTKEAMRRDVELMKKLNVNASRSSHYPNPPYWYELCDEYGIYVMDEANIESHGLGSLPSNSPDWHTAFMERGIRMVERDKNYPSIVSWSLGNEAGFGPNHAAISAWIKEFDPTRPVHYEGAQNIYGYRWPSPEPKDRVYTDIISRMYRLTEDMVALATQTGDNRPIIWCEYAHSQGNSTGDLAGYWEAIRKYHRLVGGFVWDWRDQLITKPSGDGKTLWKFGTDYNQAHDDLLPIQKGLISADGKIKSGGWQAKYVWQRAEFIPDNLEEGEITLKNWFSRTNLDRFNLKWEITEDGKIIAEALTIAPSIQPGGSGAVKLKLPSVERKAGKHYYLNLSLLLKQDELWAEKGYSIAHQQFSLGHIPAKDMEAREATLSMVKDATKWVVKSGDTEFSINSKTGYLNRMTYEGIPLISGPLKPNFWRALTDNDLASGLLERQGFWKQITDGLELEHMESYPYWNGIVVKTQYSTADATLRLEQTCTFVENNTLQIHFRMIPSEDLPDIPRIGMETSIPNSYNRMEWLGRGPWETYADKRSGALIARYSANVEDDFTYYVRPQESSNKTDVHWVTLTNQDHLGLKIESMDQPINFSAKPFSQKQLELATRIEELGFSDKIFLHIDHKQMGVGGDNTWSMDAAPHKEFRIPAKVYDYSFKIQVAK